MKSRVMILRPGALGDTLMLLPSLISLKEDYEIIVVGRLPGIDYLKPYVSQCFDYERAGWHGLFLQTDSNSPPIDLDIKTVIAFLSDPENIAYKNLKLWFPGANVHLFSPFPDESLNIHTSEYVLCCVEKAGLDIDPEKCFKNANEKPLLHFQKKDVRKSQIVIHPGSGSMKKNYSPEFWVKVIKAISNDPFYDNSRIILLLGPAEEKYEKYFTENINEGEAHILFYPDKERLLEELYNTILFIGHDSGITHLAAMLGASVIALFKTSSVTQWRPLGPKVNLISGVLDESNLFDLVLQHAVAQITMRS